MADTKEFTNDMFDEEAAAQDEDDDEPVGRAIYQPGETYVSGNVFAEDELQREYFKGRSRRRLARVIQGVISIGSTLTLGGLLFGLYGDQDEIQHENPTQEELDAETHVFNPVTIIGMVLLFLGVGGFGFGYLIKGWHTAEDWGYIDIAL